MAGGDKKWDVSAERDLCVAIILGNAESERVRHNWPKIFAFMNQLGYGFTKDAISQHFTKVIMKDFKARHGTTGLTPTGTPQRSGGGTAAPRKRAAAKRTPTKRAAKRQKVESDDDEDDDDEDEDADHDSSEEKPKMEDDRKVKLEHGGSRARERSTTMFDGDASFEDWLVADAGDQ